MIPADRPIRRSTDSKLLYISAGGGIHQAARRDLIEFLQWGDVIVANDAATLPAGLQGLHARTGEQIEVRLAGRQSLASEPASSFTAIVFGSGDYRTRTEERAPPPELHVGDLLTLGPLTAVVEEILDHARLITLRFEASATEFWRGIAVHGRPIQYAHLQTPLELWDVWTSIAGPPVAYEPPSAGFALDWELLGSLHERGIEFVTITHAAGISSTGDAQLDRRLPLDESYRIPAETARAIRLACVERRRVVAIGTTVVRALEHSASVHGYVIAGDEIATQRIDADTQLRVVDAILSGAHEPRTSHYEMLRAFADADVLERTHVELDSAGFRTHEFGDFVLIERGSRRYAKQVAACPELLAVDAPINHRERTGQPA